VSFLVNLIENRENKKFIGIFLTAEYTKTNQPPRPGIVIIIYIRILARPPLLQKGGDTYITIIIYK